MWGTPTFSCRGQASLSQNSAAAREWGCQPGKEIWVGLHSLHLPVGGAFSLRFTRIFSGPMSTVCVLVAQLCLTLCNTTGCSLPGSSVRGILQARILEWVTMPFSNNGIRLCHKKEHDFAICTTWMEVEMIIRSEVSQMKKDKHCVIPLTCGI